MMLRLTARRLVQRQTGCHSLGRRRLPNSIVAFHFDGWQLAYYPPINEPDRVVVAVRKAHPMADLIQLTYLESREQRLGRIQLPHKEIEEPIDCSLADRAAGKILARYGLVLMDCDEKHASLAAINPELANVVNSTRYGGSRKGFNAYRLTQAALGRPSRPQRLYEPARIQAAELLEQFDLDASRLCDPHDYVHLISNWLMSERLAGQPR